MARCTAERLMRELGITGAVRRKNHGCRPTKPVSACTWTSSVNASMNG
ncbi:hypothetical protein [Streptomyces lancefieldiae]|uniref:Transposase n=1 Tax=Streptomyces lancefieldiae TaxID=3075520 RepID=A0ABU3B1E3_9ACTN|nr:hypothetical protein [Streptomyces sp. DSM 40712]MDT0616272.1 hypothetical protein [Streptomyces sp. DSM 40712]